MQNKNREIREERIVNALRRIIRGVDVYSRELSAQYSLTGPQLLCLRAVSSAGELSLGTLASVVSLSPATVTGIVDRLEHKGLIARRRRSSDRRSVAVGLTRSGQTLVEQAPAPLQETFSRRLARLPVDEQKEIARVLEKIVDMMQAETVERRSSNKRVKTAATSSP